jgi:hypothetical protein
MSMTNTKSPASGFDIVNITPISEDNDDLSIFLEKISKRESSNRLKVISKNGHMGKYQFSPKTLTWLGYNDYEKFLNSSDLQDEVMIKYLKKNKKILHRYINKWDNKVLNGKLITESGILAAAHLVGPGGVIEFFKTMEEVVDGNGVKISEYLFKFSGYNLLLD